VDRRWGRPRADLLTTQIPGVLAEVGLVITRLWPYSWHVGYSLLSSNRDRLACDSSSWQASGPTGCSRARGGTGGTRHED
jgi:hypothetical protein